MKQRQQIIDLSGFPTGAPFQVPIKCSHWFLRVFTDRTDQTMDGVSFFRMGPVDASTSIVAVEVDYPPIFDEHGKPVVWDHIVWFNPGDNALNGVIILVHVDQ